MTRDAIDSATAHQHDEKIGQCDITFDEMGRRMVVDSLRIAVENDVNTAWYRMVVDRPSKLGPV
jgi:hypothetical protein